MLLGRTRFGRYVYAIGGNSEAARRAGISLARVRTMCFTLCSFTAGIAGIIYASRLRSVSTNLDGGTLVLYAVAAAVIGGTSLFGGRGRMVHAVVGGLVIAAIDNGMSLQGFSAASKYIVTAIVLLVAVTIDALARRGSATAYSARAARRVALRLGDVAVVGRLGRRGQSRRRREGDGERGGTFVDRSEVVLARPRRRGTAAAPGTRSARSGGRSVR